MSVVSISGVPFGELLMVVPTDEATVFYRLAAERGGQEVDRTVVIEVE